MADRITELQHLTGANILAPRDYVLNAVGNRIQPTRFTPRATRITNYGYDGLDRLTGVVSTDVAENETFSFDAVGNQLQAGQMHDAANRILEDASFSYQWDANGNLTQKTNKTDPAEVTTYTWDAENHLIRVEKLEAGGLQLVAEYKYDAFGRRIRKEVFEWNSSTSNLELRTSIAYIYDGADILLEADGNNVLKVKYTHATGIDRPLMREELDSSLNTVSAQFYHQDGNNNIVALSDLTGNLLESYEYSAFGKMSVFDASHNPTTEPPLQRFTFTGREFDPETRLYFYRARYYDSEIGMFLSEDPIGFFGNDFNFYRYVLNNPISWVDPFGLQQRIINVSSNELQFTYAEHVPVQSNEFLYFAHGSGGRAWHPNRKGLYSSDIVGAVTNAPDWHRGMTLRFVLQGQSEYHHVKY